MTSLEIRAVRPSEFEAAGAMTRAAYHEFYAGDGETYLERLGDVAGRAGAALVLVALQDSHIVGTATLELDQRIPNSSRPPLEPDEAHLRMLGVDPAVRRSGIGRQLVRACIDIARSRGKQRLTLDTIERMTAARAMYESMGFRGAGTSDRIPGVTFLMYERSLEDA